MSNQCRSCGRDLNNNYIPYANAYASAGNSSGDRESSISSASSYNTRSSSTSSSALSNNNNNNCSPMGKLSQMASAASQSASASASAMAMSSTSMVAQTQLTAKVMFGTVGAIKELREKEKSRQTTARATSDRRN